MSFRLSFVCLMLVGLCLGACQQAPEGASATPSPSTTASPEAPQATPEPEADLRSQALKLAQDFGEVSNRRRAVLMGELLGEGVESQWDAAPAKEPGAYLVWFELKQGEDVVRAEWHVVPLASRVEPANDAARKVQALSMHLDADEVMVLVPDPWVKQHMPAAPAQIAADSPAPAARPKPPSPAPAPAQPPPAAGPSEVRLVGLMTGDIEKAILRVNGQHYTVGVGGSAGGYRLVSIAPGTAVVSRSGRSLRLSLDTPTATAKPKPKPSSPAPAAQASQPAPAPAPAAAPTPNPPAAQLPPSVEPGPGQQVKVLNNDSLDASPPIELEGGWRKFETGEE